MSATINPLSDVMGAEATRIDLRARPDDRTLSAHRLEGDGERRASLNEAQVLVTVHARRQIANRVTDREILVPAQADEIVIVNHARATRGIERK